MRLIDADKLLEELEHGAYSSMRKLISQQPTVDAEPIIHAHWIQKGFDCECSNCGQALDWS